MFQYIIFHKPYQVLSQFSREGDKKTLQEFFPHLQKDIYPVGRLDFDSEGLLLLTNDKALNHRLLDPAYAHKRTYHVQVDGAINEEALNNIRKGVVIQVDGKPYKTKPAEVHLPENEPEVAERDPPVRYRKSIPTSWIALTLTEGKNRQVRRMTAAVGFPTLRLIRYSIGSVTIDGLQPGMYKKYDSSIKNLLLSKS